MSSQSDAKMKRAYEKLMLPLIQVGVVPKKYVIDNNVSQGMKDTIRNNYNMTLKLVPPGYHRRNAAEAAIQNFKAYFLSVLAGTADNFHCHYGTGCYHKPN